MLFDGLEILEGSSVVNFTFPTGTSFPTSPDQGEIFYKQDVKKPYIYIDTAWVEMSTGSQSGSSPTIVNTIVGATGTQGSLVYGLTEQKLFVHNGTSFVECFTESNPKPVTVVSSIVNLSGNSGELVFNTSDSSVYVYNSGTWYPSAPKQEKIYDIGITAPGDIQSASTIVFFVASRAFILPTTFAGSQAVIGTSGGGDAIFSLFKNGSIVGSISFIGTSTVGSFLIDPLSTSVSADGVHFAPGDVLSIDSPAANLPTNLAITLRAII